ncbi:hypothetical protein NITLEN_10712 [Nitrospira lenta]|uniref:Uncharacterized protein n=1 Tax=Nitrospira lenta TaxID=1436998 RepID=A0A330L9M8_9BACT|nr:hypothetical protein NITLEN_10712 [Nitrospira lenta]
MKLEHDNGVAAITADQTNEKKKQREKAVHEMEAIAISLTIVSKLEINAEIFPLEERHRGL